jgi:hypothetical protein
MISKVLIDQCGMQVRKAVVRQPRKPLGELVSAKEIKTTNEKEEADKNMEELLHKLMQRNGINLLQCVMNHQSFSQTVENLFALSFLVRSSLQPTPHTKGPGGMALFS